MNEETNIEQLSDNDTIAAITSEYMNIREYAESVGQTYENVRRKVAKIKNTEEFKDNIQIMINPDTNQPMTYIGKKIQDYLKSTTRSEPILVENDTEKVRELTIKLEEVTADRDKQRAEKELYMKQLIEAREKSNTVIDTTKYMLIEDHSKELEEMEQKNQDLKNENNSLKEQKELLIQDAENKKKKLNEAETDLNKIKSEKMLIEAEKSKIEAENDIMKQKHEQEITEALKLGFFARRRKLKELQAKQGSPD